MKNKSKASKLNWTALLSAERRKPKKQESSSKTGVGRQEVERDYDRILFAAPTRRLADKTQVFPLDKNDSVRTRLTHSHEVANLARSIGVRIAFDNPDLVFGSNHEKLYVNRVVPSLLAAIGLSHDLGNPPFGHQGEEAMRQWFEEHNKNIFKGCCHKDFLEFDGNAQTFRLLTKLQILNDNYGLNLTYATLAALMKYPTFPDSDQSDGYKKWGIFESEKEIAEEVWENVGLKEGQRHPLTFIMEACDDIAYSVLDAEDTVKKGYASFYDLIGDLQNSITKNNVETQGELNKDKQDRIIQKVINASLKTHGEYKNASLSSSELNDISMQMFRVFAIFHLMTSTHEAFLANIQEIMQGTVSPSFKLIKQSNAAKLCNVLKNFDKRHGFNNKAVLKLELEGSNYIKSLMDLLWEAIDNKHVDGCYKNKAFIDYAYGKISENYRRVYEKTEKKVYNKCQLLCDVVSGMTDSYIISLHDELRHLYDGFRSKRQ